jgi:hypothetical protein
MEARLLAAFPGLKIEYVDPATITLPFTCVPPGADMIALLQEKISVATNYCLDWARQPPGRPCPDRIDFAQHLMPYSHFYLPQDGSAQFLFALSCRTAVLDAALGYSWYNSDDTRRGPVHVVQVTE